MVCVINNRGIENWILIECNRTDLPNNYAIPFTDDYVSDTDSGFIAKFQKVDGGFITMNCVSLFVLMSWKLISFRIHFFVWIVERFLRFLYWRIYMS